MKFFNLAFLLMLLVAVESEAVQVAFFVDDENPGLSLEGEFSHVAVSYKGRWLHSHPSKVNGRLTNFPGVHLTENLIEIGLNYVVFENSSVPEPDEDFYNRFKDKTFNMFATWNSKTETHCSILVGKHLRVRPEKMMFKSSIWKNFDVSSVKGKLGLSPKEIYKHIMNDSGYDLYYKSPFSTYKGLYKRTFKKMKCATFLN